jgi:CubicO group peptidase (beta-lactamase class C family)
LAERIASLTLFLFAASAVGQESARFSRIDDAMSQAIASGQTPGAVVLIVHNQKEVFRKAYGFRAKLPAKVLMTTDTIFDLASLTKPIVTATSIWILIEQGRLRLDDPVARHWPDFAAAGKDKVTIEQCLLHTSGLTPDNPLSDYEGGRAKALARIAALKLDSPPGTKFRYSDVGYIVLGYVVERVSGQSLDAFAAERIFKPLGMSDTGFGVPAGQRDRCAPTERIGGEWLIGKVHDPRARLLGGVAGHAGLFGTADDLSHFADMMLANGKWNDKQILRAETVKRMTEPHPLPAGGSRTYGWDCDSAYSSNRGRLFPKGKSFGHTGFTGPSIWIDPVSRSSVIFLCSRLHPDGKGNVTSLRGKIATLAAEELHLKDE